MNILNDKLMGSLECNLRNLMELVGDNLGDLPSKLAVK